MSNHVTSDVKRGSTARANDRLVLLEIADQASHEGWAVLRIRTIAENTLVAMRTVHDCIARLVDAGELESRSGKHRGGSNVFRVLLSESRKAGEPVPVELAAKFRLGSAEPAHPPVAVPAEGAAGGSAEPAEGGYADAANRGSAAHRIGGMQPAADIKDSSPSLPPKTDTSLRSVSAAGTPLPSIEGFHDEADQRAELLASGFRETTSPWLFTRGSEKRDLIWDTVLLVAGIASRDIPRGPGISKARDRMNAAVGELRRAGASPNEVVARARRFVKGPGLDRRTGVGRRPTPHELASRWAELGDASEDRFVPPSRVARAVEQVERVVAR